MMHMEQRLGQIQTQRLMLTQKMQQALHVLQLSGVELEQYVQDELETNPVLDQLRKESDAEPLATPEATSTTSNEPDPQDESSFDLDRFVSRWEQRIQEGRDMSVNPDLAMRRDYYENSITKEESFSAHLLNQLRLAFKDEKKYLLGERIIGDFDDRGYFTGSLEEIAEEKGVELSLVERTLYRIQRFEPIGVGARDVAECLLLQIRAEFPEEQALAVLVEEHLDDLQRRHIPKIAKAMRITTERVEELKSMLSTLNPWPGHEYSSEPTQYIAADLVVEKIDNEFVVYLSNERVPELRVSPYYEQVLKDGEMDKKGKTYVRKMMESAKWLIRNIDQRQQTILKIGRAILDVQLDFMREGVSKIRPLTLQEIADVVGVHEATVSRTTRGKYMQTPQGLFELKYFFSPGLKSSTGEAKSSKSVQDMVAKIIEGEDKKKPLSDQKIADILKGEGIKIARRTITKYREALKILATTMRKEY